MSEPSLLEQLVEAFRCLPGVGPKTAQRMAFQLLERNRDGGRKLAEVLQEALTRIGRCQRCRNFTEQEQCRICRTEARNNGQLCVVESPADVMAIESAAIYQGRYFVLLGRLSPLDGIGPDDLGLEQLESQLAEGSVTEMIVATNPTVEGEATAFYLQKLARKAGVEVSRIAHGVPIGGELEYIDASTLAHAFGSRSKVE